MKPDDDNSGREAQVERMLHTAARTERAPARLRAALDDLDRRAARRQRSSARGLPLRLGAATVSSCVALAVVLVLALGGGAAEPSLAAAAALATKGPTAAAPAPDPRAPATLLNAHVGDLQFPNWERKEGWRSSGERVDKLGDRSVTTVYYEKDGRQMAYSIVSQPSLKQPATQHERYVTMHKHGRTVVVWTEDNHTCVLSAKGISAADLWQLAASSLTEQSSS
jgi:hypothetical protein